MPAYCSDEDIAAVAFDEGALVEISGQYKLWAREACSAEADAYLAKAGLLPLLTVDKATAMHVAKMAAFALLAHRATLEDERRLRQGRDDAIAYFTMVAAGEIEPTATTDTGGQEPDPATTGGAGYVASLPERGWAG